ncbi:exopolysaccharide biosynthesis protein [Gymnodinialimonas sp. 57CJ19]|uniref:exopolysaccharide biosynthesis protein n=1 Tax=Gymnodinialimonas sp. 57CJ19 TaxID=3138498 RepID=UPI0031343839
MTMETSSNLASSDATPEPALSDLTDDLSRAAKQNDGKVAKIVDEAGANGLLPMMTVMGLLLVSPLSGIPLFSTSVGVMIFLCAVQAAMGRDRLWLPGFLRRQRIDPSRIEKAMDRIHSAAEWLEARATSRLEWLSLPPARAAFLTIAAVYGAVMPIMELIPFTSSLLGAAVVMIGLGLLLRDGVLLLISILPTLIAAGVIFRLLLA